MFGESYILVFDPARQEFSRIQHPGGTEIRMIAARPDGKLWVHTLAPDHIVNSLEVFDGKTFLPVMELFPENKIRDIRWIHATSHGDLWMGGASSLARLEGKRLRLIDSMPRIHRQRGFLNERNASGNHPGGRARQAP